MSPKYCLEKPERLAGQPIGQYHCPYCGNMLIAGTPSNDLMCGLRPVVVENAEVVEENDIYFLSVTYHGQTIKIQWRGIDPENPKFWNIARELACDVVQDIELGESYAAYCLEEQQNDK